MNETWLITGANRGIGHALALAAAHKGMNVISTMRDPDAADLPPAIESHRLDVTSPEQIGAVADTLKGVAIDVLVCNAGIFRARGPLSSPEYTPENWRDTFQTNVMGPFLTVQAFLPNLQLSKRPRIAVISSAMGSNANAKGGSYIYRASKAAATNLASNLAVELKPLGISVGAYHPGWVRTDMGGSGADVSTDECVTGLLACFARLGLETTGCFQNYSGETIPF